MVPDRDPAEDGAVVALVRGCGKWLLQVSATAVFVLLKEKEASTLK
jgi:hypothetical protein